MDRENIAESASRTPNAAVAFAALRSSGHIFNEVQQQRLVDTIANNNNKFLAKATALNVPGLTEGQKKQLIRASLSI